MSVTELQAACAKPSAVDELVEAKFNLAPTLRMHPELQIREVFALFLNHRSETGGGF